MALLREGYDVGGSTLPSSITPVQQMLSSCSGAILTSLLTTPFDVVKVRLQAQQQASLAKPCYLLECRCLDGVSMCVITPEGNHIHFPRFRSTFDAFLKIAQLEGMRSWWKGLSPTLAMAVPSTVIYYTSYDQLKVALGFQPHKRNVVAPMLAGAFSRIVAVAVTCPVELVRTKMQSRLGYSYSELVSVIRNAVQQNGILSLWRGLSPMLLRDVPFSIIYWFGYEYLKLKLNSVFDPSYSSFVPFVSGSVAGGVSAVVTNPLDVAKTHMQVDLGESSNRGRSLGAGSLFNVLKNVISEHSYRGLYAGLAPRVAKTAPACAIMIGSYEVCKDYFHEYNRTQAESSMAR